MKVKKNKKPIQKLDEKRVFKGYKIAPTIYEKCMIKAAVNNTTVANLLEDYLYDYAE